MSDSRFFEGLPTPFSQLLDALTNIISAISGGALQAVEIFDGSKKAEIDSLEYLVTITTPHHKVHEGDYYRVTDQHTGAAGVAKYWHLKTPADGANHFEGGIFSNDEVLIEFFEAPTLTADGNALVELNSNRQSANATNVEAYDDPTVTADGTLLQAATIGGGGGPFSLGGAVRSGTEWILAQNESYLIKVTPTNNNTLIVVDLEWYESIALP